METTSPAWMTRAPPSGTPLMLTRLPEAASSSQRPLAARSVVCGSAFGAGSSTSERMAPVTESNTTLPP